MTEYYKTKQGRGFWEDGKTGSTRNLSLHLDNNRMAESNYSATLKSVEGLQLPGENLDGKLWLILVNFSS